MNCERCGCPRSPLDLFDSGGQILVGEDQIGVGRSDFAEIVTDGADDHGEGARWTQFGVTVSNDHNVDSIGAHHILIGVRRTDERVVLGGGEIAMSDPHTVRAIGEDGGVRGAG